MPGQGRFETGEEAREAIRDDLRRCRETLAGELGRPPRLLCFPWAVAGKVAETEAVEAGFRASFADRFPGFRAALPGNTPHRLMRLKHQWIRKLPA
jgi:peptidoglycan/xylan/chitin deacetylase (PgdA/CDA1 family)